MNLLYRNNLVETISHLTPPTMMTQHRTPIDNESIGRFRHTYKDTIPALTYYGTAFFICIYSCWYITIWRHKAKNLNINNINIYIYININISYQPKKTTRRDSNDPTLHLRPHPYSPFRSRRATTTIEKHLCCRDEPSHPVCESLSRCYCFMRQTLRPPPKEKGSSAVRYCYYTYYITWHVTHVSPTNKTKQNKANNTQFVQGAELSRLRSSRVWYPSVLRRDNIGKWYFDLCSRSTRRVAVQSSQSILLEHQPKSQRNPAFNALDI